MKTIKQILFISTKDQHMYAANDIYVKSTLCVTFRIFNPFKVILPMVCKSFLKFVAEDNKNIFKSACCLFIHQKMELTMDKDVGPQREKMLMDLDKFANTASDMINKRSTKITFDDVINIKNRHKVNSFLARRQRENPDMNYSDLNSIFVDHMFARTDNPTDSSISSKYIDRIHEAACILEKMSKSIENEKRDDSRPFSSPTLMSIQQRMDNLIELINAEKFDFEDVEAWRMGAIMENLYKDHWTNRSNELAQLRIEISERILAGEIVSEGGVNEIIQEKCNQIIHEETTGIKAISDSELEAYFKNRLIDQLRDQVENVSRDVRINLRNEFLKYKHNIEKEDGKFSDRELQRKILEGINNMAVVENLSDHELDRKFIEFWYSEDVIGSPELDNLKKNIFSTNAEQRSNYRRYVKAGVEFALESLRFEISVRSLFPDLQSIYDWDFTAQKLQAIRVMEDKDYFEDQRNRHYGNGSYQHRTSSVQTRSSSSQFKYEHKYLNQIYLSNHENGYYDKNNHWHWSYGKKVNPKKDHKAKQKYPSENSSFFGNVVESAKNFFTGSSGNQIEANKYGTFMTELYSKFDKNIDDNPLTQRNFEGMVDQSVITDLCVSFRKALEDLAAKYKISNYLKPKFVVTCVMFASFKMLLVRLNENSDHSSKKSDPVTQLEMKKDYFKKLFIMKLKGAQKSQIWQQQIVHRLKETIAQIYLQIDGSQATHYEVYDLIRTFSNSQGNHFPSIETYRKFRFCMYMQIMNDTRSGSDKAAVFRKWKRICNYDMEPCERDFIRSGFQFA